MEVIEGIIEDIIYHNEENGYTVISVYTETDDVTCVGTMYNLSVGEEIRATGVYITHHTYGDQFKVEQFHTFIPRDIKAMERYLGSGAIKGIGPALSKRIIERFGGDTFHIIETAPHKLSEVRGISDKKAQEIAGLFEEQRRMRQVIIFLQEFGISLTFALKIYKEYEDNTITLIKQNPYRLAEDIHGIGFKVADQLAVRIGFNPHSIERIKAAITYVLNKGAASGHVFLDRTLLMDTAKTLIGIDTPDIDNALMALQLDNKIVIEYRGDTEAVYLLLYYNMEQYVANKLFDLVNMDFKPDKNIESEIQKLEKEQGIAFDRYQKEAIIEAMNFGVFILTGGPGTGKTTTINAIIESFMDRGMEVLLAAPTGRAAKRMTETTGYEAKTIHRLLEIAFGKDDLHQKFERNEDYPLEADVVIIDEVSMVDITLMYHLLKAIVPGTRLILVGDRDQLPSVGPGNVLKDMIHSKELYTVTLKEVFRQAAQSDIVTNAHRINSGEYPVLDRKKDFFYIRRNEPMKGLNEIITLIRDRLPKFTGESPSQGIQILTPMRKGVLGVDNLNQALQSALNPPHKDKKEKVYRHVTFRESDKVMQIRNNYNAAWEVKNHLGYKIDEGSGIFNGDMGVIESINHYSEQMEVLFDDGKKVKYDFTNLDELELAYAITIHKSQGSEYPVVILPVFSGPPMLMSRNLLYTAITRAKKYVVLVGKEEVINQMIDNNREILRHSMLHERISQVFNVLTKN